VALGAININMEGKGICLCCEWLYLKPLGRYVASQDKAFHSLILCVEDIGFLRRLEKHENIHMARKVCEVCAVVF
jgi:hypothetical protein